MDLYAAFLCAKRHKSSKPYVKRFERHLKQNLTELRDTLWDRTYKPAPSSCFIIERPKKREVFAAQFRDRVVHHLYYNYTHELFERTFIADSYSCIPGRGTHYGIHRLADHIRRASRNYTKTCYVMKLDIRGYFMHIDRQQLLEIATQSLEKMSARTDIADKDFLLWLTREIILLDPNKNCRIVGSEDDWLGLDPAKSMRFVNSGKGMPIGNLTSQLFSNVYLNEFDQFMKRTLKCHHYGRYVDDAYVVSTDREWLLSLVPDIKSFLSDRLGLTLHMGKLTVTDTRYGVEFLGAFVKPYRTYASNACLRRMERNIRNMSTNDGNAVIRSVNSFLGVLSHHKTYRIRRAMFLRVKFLKIGTFDNGMKTFQ
jgi:retron-type reverse transcriptase